MIQIWHNKQTDAPSIEVGLISIDLTKEETPEQQELFRLVMAHPDVIAKPHVQCPITEEIAEAFEDVLCQEVRKNIFKKRLGQKAEYSVDNI